MYDRTKPRIANLSDCVAHFKPEPSVSVPDGSPISSDGVMVSIPFRLGNVKPTGMNAPFKLKTWRVFSNLAFEVLGLGEPDQAPGTMILVGKPKENGKYVIQLCPVFEEGSEA